MNKGTEERRTLRLFKPYPAYKESGVEWLGEIPAHWDVKPIRALAKPGYKTFTDGDWIESPFIRDDGIRLIQTGNIGVSVYVEQGFRYIDEHTFQSLHCTEVLPGDILICRLADPVGRACLAPNLGCRMITSVDVCILKTGSNIDPLFVVYALSAPEYLAWMGAICRGGTRDRVSRSMLGSIRIQVPPYDEQRAIATFLKRETAKIDALVAKKERLIELLQEKRTVLITRAVTKGLDPNAPMKDSGVEWLGEIPAHWEVKKVAWLTECLDGRRIPLNAEERGQMQGEYPYWGANSIVDYVDKWLFDETLVLLGEDGAPFFDRTKPVAFHVSGKIWVNNHIHVLRPRPVIDAAFLAHALNCVDYRAFIDGTTRDKLTQNDMNAIPFQCPPLSEQRAIVVFLDRETAKIDALTAKVREGIERLKEYRTALISAAVTGKIDVREVAS